ncbi:MAG TPA: acetyl-CoA carboxylase carboxyltransferase subunit alpha [Candidatus Acetothermia bacterium]|nr:acetyl-CoA carboxylase carboxyltransferase subunit alpha [Candidatus Acetothermia bacterium]
MSDEKTLDLLEAKIQELRELNKVDGLDLSAEISKLEKKLAQMRTELYANLADWERVRIARNTKRPYALDYIGAIFPGFYELHGDRMCGDDRALLTGFAELDGRKVAIIAQQKGRDPAENKERYFGMARPQGYRKATRMMHLAERFRFPIISLIDTPGAYPGLESEEKNIGGAIAASILSMLEIEVPTIAVIIGEGGSGGAVAIGAADRVLMLENGIFSVISPEGAAAILWKSKERVKEAAASLKLTAPELLDMGVIDEVIPEPLGGAHKDIVQTASALKQGLIHHLDELSEKTIDEIMAARYERYRDVGRYSTLSD